MSTETPLRFRDRHMAAYDGRSAWITKPCPWPNCKSPKVDANATETRLTDGRVSFRARVECRMCGCAGPLSLSFSARDSDAGGAREDACHEAIELWNDR